MGFQERAIEYFIKTQSEDNKDLTYEEMEEKVLEVVKEISMTDNRDS